MVEMERTTVVYTWRAGPKSNHDELVNESPPSSTSLSRNPIMKLFQKQPEECMRLAVVCVKHSVAEQAGDGQPKAKPCHTPSPIVEQTAWIIGYSLTGNYPGGIMAHSHSASVVKIG
jgi:hypothetical protein